MNSKITSSHCSYFINSFVKSPIELEVKIRKNTCNFTSGLKPATSVKGEFCKNFHGSFHHSHFCGKTFGGFLSKKNYFWAISKNAVLEDTSPSYMILKLVYVITVTIPVKPKTLVRIL